MMGKKFKREHTQVLPYNPFFGKVCITYSATTTHYSLEQKFKYCQSELRSSLQTLAPVPNREEMAA